MELKHIPTKSNRKKFTTMLLPELSSALKKDAIDREISVADIFEELAIDYLKTTKSSLKNNEPLDKLSTNSR